MSSHLRVIGLVTLLAMGTMLIIILGVRRVETPLGSSFAPAFQLAGTPIKALDHLVTRVIPVGDLDEREFGEVFHARYGAQTDTTHGDFAYLNDLVAHLSADAEKPFRYRAYTLPWSEPNAMALPGGVMLVTTGLLEVLHTEAEVAAVLSHEIGHIERGHCLDAVRFALLADKLGDRTFGDVVDLAVRLLVSHSFSKTQEDDADEYAYALLLESPYDPRGLGLSFESLLEYRRQHGATRSEDRQADLFRDYFRSHPPLEVRAAKFGERAEKWWRRHEGQSRPLGAENLRRRTSVYQTMNR